MERLQLTHDGWYALPKWERDTWLARELYKEDQYLKMIDSLVDKQKNQLKNPEALAPVFMLQSLMV